MAASKTQRIAGWILSGLVGALLAFSASFKLIDGQSKAEMFEKGGYTVENMFWIGLVEVSVTVLFLIPRTSFLGAILLAGYLGGAVNSHVRAGEPFFVPIVVGVVVFLGYALRRPDVIKSAFGRG